MPDDETSWDDYMAREVRRVEAERDLAVEANRRLAGQRDRLRQALEEIDRIYHDDSLSNAQAQDRTHGVVVAALDRGFGTVRERKGLALYVLAEVTDEMRERVMEAVAAEFGACSNVTADRIIAAAFSTSRKPGGDS